MVISERVKKNQAKKWAKEGEVEQQEKRQKGDGKECNQGVFYTT